MKVVNGNRIASAGSRVRFRLVADERLVSSIREGDRAAFEAMYDRLSPELLAFCIYMLGSRADAEDALQATYASAYRALLADTRPVKLRPWLFTIARNECISTLRKRRPTLELNGEPALTGDPVKLAEVDEELRETLAGIRRLPEEQRAALVLAEVHGLSQAQIAGVLGVRAEQVKAYVYQARSNLISEREAREADCVEIREELADAHGAARLRGRLRRHVRACAGCREYVDDVVRQQRQLAALLPIVPSLAVKYRALEEALGVAAGDPMTYAGGAAVGASVAGAAAEVAGGGIKAIAAKVAAGLVAVGASAGVGVSVLSLGAGEPSSRGAATHETASVASGGRAAGAPGSDSQDDAGAGAQRGHGHASPGTSRSHRLRLSRTPPGSLGGPRQPGDRGPVGARGGGSGSVGDGQYAGGRGGAQGQGSSGGGTASAERAPQRAQTLEAHRQRHEQTTLRREVREREHDAVRPERESSQRDKEERETARREHKPEGASRSPKTQEERERKREERRRRREEGKLEEAPPAP